MGYRQYRDVFFATHGFGPYECHFCSEYVSFDDVHIHHLDHNRSNNDPANLAAAHDACHKSHHHGSKGISDETRAKISRAMKGRVFSEETRRKIGEAKRARGKTGPQSEEVRAKKSESIKRSWDNDPDRKSKVARGSDGRFVKKEG